MISNPMERISSYGPCNTITNSKILGVLYVVGTSHYLLDGLEEYTMNPYT